MEGREDNEIKKGGNKRVLKTFFYGYELKKNKTAFFKLFFIQNIAF
jgi:hypothetical protein